jgi:hypothetical protein
MSVEPKRLAVAFFVPRQGDDPSPRELLRRAGATDIATAPTTSSDPSGLIDCSWAGLACKGFLDTLPDHLLLVIFFWRSSFLEMLPEVDEPTPVEDNGAPPLVRTFAQACEDLSPEVAFIVTRLDQADPDRLRSYEWMVLARLADVLADERFGVLYLNDEVSQYWTPHPVRDDRDSWPVQRGRMVFAGRGSYRWF